MQKCNFEFLKSTNQPLLQRSFLFFINPIAGTKSKKNVHQFIEDKCIALQFTFEILPTSIDGNYHFLQKHIAKKTITDVVICGGDGTVNQIVQHLIHTNIRVGILPMGSGNGLALTVGISKNVEKAFATILAGKATAIDAFTINESFSCMLTGIGLDAQVAHNFAQQTTRGLATYFKESVKHFIKAKPYQFIIKVDKSTISTNAFFICIANSNQFGNNITIAPKASISDGLLDIIVVNKIGKFSLFVQLLQQIKKGKTTSINNNTKAIHYFQTKLLTIANPQLAPLHIDGEPCSTAPQFDIKIIEKAFFLMQP